MSNIHWFIFSFLFLIFTYSGVIVKETLSVANCLNPCKGKKNQGYIFLYLKLHYFFEVFLCGIYI